MDVNSARDDRNLFSLNPLGCEMSTLIVLVGVRGAGKSTIQQRIGTDKNIRVLQPSTTRAPRGPDDREYDFRLEPDWDKGDLAWQITAGSSKYGMRISQIDAIEGVGLTVFHPSHMSALGEFTQKRPSLEVITVGLDTVDSLATCAARTGGDATRRMSQAEFDSELAVVRSCDVVVSGDIEAVVAAVLATAKLFGGRGGVLPEAVLIPLMKAGALLEGALDSNISPASYDLRLGDDVWCQGQFQKLTAENPTLKIPAYSYAVVSALEIATLPTFVTGRFDLKVALFFQGVVLSNGPQVDPGYRGALFCMLYNGSDVPVGITRGNHFATLEFVTTTFNSKGYKKQYQGKVKLSDFMPGHAAVSKGGQILERFIEQDTAVRGELSLLRGVIVAMAGLAISMVALSVVAFWNLRSDASRLIDQGNALQTEVRAFLNAHAVENLRANTSTSAKSDSPSAASDVIKNPAPLASASAKIGNQGRADSESTELSSAASVRGPTDASPSTQPKGVQPKK